MNKYQKAGYKNRKDYNRAFKRYIRPYLKLTLPEELSPLQKCIEIWRIKHEYLRNV